MAGVAAALPSGCSLAQWKASLFPHEPDSAASHGWNWRKCALPTPCCHRCVGEYKRWSHCIHISHWQRAVPADNMHSLTCSLVVKTGTFQRSLLFPDFTVQAGNKVAIRRGSLQ